MVNERVLRAARPEDARAVARVHREARLEAMPWLPELHTPAEDVDFFAAALARDEARVGESGGLVVAFAVVSGDELAHLYVAPAAQRQGFGSALLDWAKELGPGGLWLWVFQRNERARRFYEERGFRLVELTDGAANEEREPDARYAWP